MRLLERNGRARRRALASARIHVAAFATAALLLTGVAPVAHAATTYYLQPTGSDSSAGTLGAPWKTLTHAVLQMRAGDTLLVRGGTYLERFEPPVFHYVGTAASPITVRNYPGERPVFKGVLYIRGASYWIFDGINATWDPNVDKPSEPLVKLMNGTGWVFRNGEVWGAHSVAGLMIGTTITGQPKDWTLSDNCIHDTIKSNATNLDHNVYVNTANTGPGVIERNIMFNALNGENVKLGAPSSSAVGPARVTIRYNTLYSAAQNTVVAWAAHDNAIDHNLLGRSIGKTWYPNMRGYDVTGANNVAHQNIGFSAAKLILNTDQNSTPVSRGIVDGGGNVFGVDPVFDSVTTCAGFSPTNVAAQEAGRYGFPIVTGDWNNDLPAPGTDTPGVLTGHAWRLRNANSTGGPDLTFGFGANTDRFIKGDWNGDGTDTAGLVRGNTVYLKNSNAAGSPDVSFAYGKSTDRFITGDWNGDGTDTIGVIRGATFYLRNSNSAGSPDITFSFGHTTGDRFIVGDWDGAGGPNGTDTVGIVRGNTVYLKNTNTAGPHDVSFSFGRTSDRFVAGDWNGDGADSIGVVRGSRWYLRNANSSGPADVSFVYQV